MSETSPPYAIKYDKSSRWLCRNCKHELAVIVNGETWLHAKVVLHNTLRASVICPNCGVANKWGVKG